MRLHLVDPLGFRSDGRPIWAFSGSAPDDGDGGSGTGGDGGGGNDGDGSGGDGDGEDPNAIGDDGLTLKGRKALQAERGKVRTLTAEVRDWRLLARDFGEDGTPLTASQVRERLAGGSKSRSGNGDGDSGDGPVDVERIRREVRREADSEHQRDLALAKVEVLAAAKFADPADAVLHLGRDVESLLARDGKPDADAIASSLEDLLQSKPHLAKRDEGPPSYDGGPRHTAPGEQGMTAFIRSRRNTRR